MIPHVYSTKQGKEETEFDLYVHNEKKIKWYDQVLLNRPSKVFVTLFLVAVAAPILIYNFYYFPSSDLPPSDGFSTGSCLLPRNARLPCGVGNMRENECHPHCCFDPANNFCFHRLPSRFTYITDRDWTEDVLLQPRIATVPYASQSSKTNLKLSISEESPTHLTLTLYDPTKNTIHGKKNDNKTYTYEVTSPEMNIVVRSTNRTIFNTARGPIIASDNIWEIAFYLTNETMYGLGELPLTPGTVKVLYNHKEGLSSIPLIFAKMKSSYHGLLIDADSPTEVSIVSNNNIVIRSITTFGIKLHLFVGPRPKDIMKDAMALIGSEPKLDYWRMGAHICSETGDSLQEGLDTLRTFINNATRASMPYDSHCGIAPIVFNSNTCEVNETALMLSGINLVRRATRRFVPHVSPYVRVPGILFEGNDTIIDKDNQTSTNGTEEDSEPKEDCYKILSHYGDIFYRVPISLEIYSGSVGENKVSYPSYDAAQIDFLEELWLYNDSVEGVVLVNSWPLDQSKNKSQNYTAPYLPYFNQVNKFNKIINEMAALIRNRGKDHIKTSFYYHRWLILSRFVRNFEKAFDETPVWNLTLLDNDTTYMQAHNNYGNHFASAFQNILDKEVPIWSSSLKMKGDVAINRQNIDTSWSNLHREIINIALGGISGHWLWSSPICGDTDNFDIDNHASLCVKWYMASTYFPLINIHSQNQARDPLAFIGTHRSLIIQAMTRRLSLLPYLYTTLQEGPVLRPMFYQFPDSENLSVIKTQFSVGEDLIIVPNLQPLQSHVHFWMPPGTWYELFGGLKMEGKEGEAVTMSTTEADFLTLIRGGSILVMQKETRATAQDTRLRSRLSLTIALECQNNVIECQATGNLYINQNISLAFTATENILNISTVGDDISPLCDPSNAVISNTIYEIYVFGLEEALNNYDHHRYLQTSINLCNLNSINEFPLT